MEKLQKITRGVMWQLSCKHTQYVYLLLIHFRNQILMLPHQGSQTHLAEQVKVILRDLTPKTIRRFTQYNVTVRVKG